MLNKEAELQLLTAMLRIRAFDDAEKTLVSVGQLHEYHPCFGRESVAVGVCLNLLPNDMITSTHRGLAHCLAKGTDPKKLLSEVCGKSSGICKGKGGAWHVYDLENGIIGTYPIVGAGIPVAVGAALAAKMKNTSQVVVSFFSEGATSTGIFHESLNMASLLEVPILFVCENNSVDEDYKKTMRNPSVAAGAPFYGIQGLEVNGEDPDIVFETSKGMIDRVRSEKKPLLLETKNPMISGSPRRNPEMYQKMLKMREEHDEVSNYVKRLINERVLTQSELSALQQGAKEELDDAVKFVENDPVPELGIATVDMFS